MSAQHTPVPAFPRGIYIDGYWSADEWREVVHLAASHRNNRTRLAKYKAEGSDPTYAARAVRQTADSLRAQATKAIGATCREVSRAAIAKATGSAS